MAGDPELTSVQDVVAVEPRSVARGEREAVGAAKLESRALAARSAQALLLGAGLVTLGTRGCRRCKGLDVGALRPRAR